MTDGIVGATRSGISMRIACSGVSNRGVDGAEISNFVFQALRSDMCQWLVRSLA
jgi:hypothetical protein